MTPRTKSLVAGIETSDSGGFTAIASTPTLDRDGEVLAAGCFAPLPSSIPVHLDHTMSAAGVIGRAVPYYVGNALHINATLASTPDAQLARTKLAEGVLDAVSVVFRGRQWEQVDGIRTCVRAELLAADVVSVPSQSEARVLSVRGPRPGVVDLTGAWRTLAAARRVVSVTEAKHALAQARRVMVEHDLAEAKRILATYPTASAQSRFNRRQVADVIARLIQD